MGAIEQNIVKQALRTGQPIPDSIRDAPELREELFLFMQAFFALNTERHSGMGLGPIPWSAIQQYGHTHWFDREQMEDLHFYIRRMDIAYMDAENAKNAK
jgi:hypothetical protein